MDYYASVSAKIKELRTNKNMTLSELADGICSISHISRIENGTRTPNALILRQISNKLGVSPDILLRTVESPNSIRYYEIIKQLYIDCEYNRFEKVFEVTSKINFDEVYSLEDKQILLALNYVCENMLRSIPELTIKRLQEVLDMSYSSGAQPTDLEFALLSNIANCHIQMKDLKKAKQIISFLELSVENTLFHIAKQPLIRFHTSNSIIAYHEKSYDKAHELIDKAISCAKDCSHHATLIECYYVKGRIYEKQNMQKEAMKWFNYSEALIDLILDTEIEQYNMIIDSYFNLQF